PVKQAAYSTVGSLLLELDGADPAAVAGYRRSLDLDPAEAVPTWTADGSAYVRRVGASPVAHVAPARLTRTGPATLTGRVRFTSPLQETWTHATDDELVLGGRNVPHGDIPGALSFEARVRVLTAGGTVREDGDAVAVEGAT